MDPVTTTLLSAFVAGATNAAGKTGEKVISEAYEALKGLIRDGYQQAGGLLRAITGVEEKPASDPRKAVLAEELAEVKAIDDPKVVAAAEAVLAAAETSSNAQTIGLDWSDVKLAQLKIGEIRVRAGAIGFRAARMEVTGAVEIPKLEVDGGRGK